MPAPRYVDAVRRQQPPPQSKEASLSQRRSPVRRGSESQTTPAPSPGQKSTPLPHDPRFIYSFAAAVGRHVTVQVKSGVEFEGTLHGPVLGSKNIHITLKHAKRIDAGGASDAGQPHETLIIPANEFVQLKAKAIPFSSEEKTENGVQATHSKNEEECKTGSDSLTEEKEFEVLPVRDENDMTGFTGDIARAAVSENKPGEPRALVAWDGGDAGEEILLEGDAGDWCQFQDEANVGVQSTFNMENYTSKLDATQSRYTEEEAERIAREIESAPRHQNFTVMDDSGICDEEEQQGPPVEVKPEVATTKKAFSWADAVKGKSTQPATTGSQHQISRLSTAIEPSEKTSEKQVVVESPQWSSAYPKAASPVECASPQLVTTTTTTYDDKQLYSEAQDDGVQEMYSYPHTSPGTYVMHPDSGLPPTLSHTTQSAPMYNDVGYSMGEGTAAESPVVEECAASFNAAPEEVCIDEPAAHYYGEPIWGPPANDPIPTKMHVPEPEPLEQPFSEVPLPNANTAVSPIHNEKPKKVTSTVVPGISFKDKLKANLKTAAPKIVPVPKQRTPANSAGHAQTKSQSSVVDPTSVAPVQSPRARSYSGKLISNPRRNELHHGDVGRALPSEEHLLSPVTVPHSPMYLSPHDMPPVATVSMMPPPMAHGPYLDMPPQEGLPRVPPPYAGFPPPMDMNHPAAQMDPMCMIRPPMHYPNQPQGPYSAANEGVSPEGEVPGSGRGGKPFQLNPRAKAFKPVSSFDSTSQGQEPFSPVPYAPVPPPGEYEPRTPQTPQPPPPPAEAPSVVQAPPPAPVPQHMPKPPGTPVEGGPPVEFKGTPPPPGARPAFIPPSNVVTPWPSFPGTGVWHSGLGPPRPGMPGGYPMFVPGVPPPGHYMQGMQDPMWRPPPMPPGMQDRQRMAMMWANHYNRVVPPNKRSSWNASKYPANAGPQTRPGRNPRRAPNGNNQAPPSSFSSQPMDVQPSGEMP